MNIGRKIASALALCFLAAGLAGCDTAQAAQDDRLTVVCTLFPEYDWVRQIAGSHAEDLNLVYLLDNGTDLHNYQPSAKDMITISECDILVYVGGESESWLDDALQTENPDRKIIRLMDVVQDAVREEEIKEGMQTEAHAESESHEDSGTPEYDEHVWLSVRNAKRICDAIADTLSEADAVHAADYQSNAQQYQAQLQQLDAAFAETAAQASVKTLVFGDKFPFRYFVEDYDLSYYAAFSGCSADVEASFETIAFLAEQLDALQTGVIFKTEASDSKLAESIIASSTEKNQEIVTLHSMQSVTAQQIADGASYLGIMQENLIALQEALR